MFGAEISALKVNVQRPWALLLVAHQSIRFPKVPSTLTTLFVINYI